MEKWNGKVKALTFSYDDGVTQDVQLIEMLNKYNLKCTFNLNSEFLGNGGFSAGHETTIIRYKIRPEDVKKVYEGHEVAVHTLTHPFLPNLDDEEVIRQVEQDRINLSKLVDYEVVGMAYPCGGENNNDHIAELIKSNTGVKYCRTITTTHSFNAQNNIYRFNPSAHHLEFDKLMKMGEDFLNLKPTIPQIFYIWGHSYELDFASEYRKNLEDFFKLIANQEDIYYATNKDVLLWHQNYDQEDVLSLAKRIKNDNVFISVSYGKNVVDDCVKALDADSDNFTIHLFKNSEDVKRVYEWHEVAVRTLIHPFLPNLDDEEVICQV